MATARRALVELGAEAFRDVDAIVLIFPTWRTNDGTLIRAIESLVAARGSVVAIPVEVGPEDAKRIAAMRADEVDAFVDLAGDDRCRRLPVAPRHRARGRARPWGAGEPMSIGTSIRARMQRGAGTPEDSVAMRVVVAGAVEVAILAVVAQGGVSGAAAILPLVMAPVGYVFSYRQRHHSNITTKVLLSVGLAGGVRGVPAECPSSRARSTRRGCRWRRCSSGCRCCTRSTSRGGATCRSRWCRA